MVDCGLFDILNPEFAGEEADGQKMKELKDELDTQLDAITDEDLLKLFHRSIEAREGGTHSHGTSSSPCLFPSLIQFR